MLWVNGVLVGIGAGIGAATGALADSLRERRVLLYRRGGSTRVMLAPVVGGHRRGGRAVIPGDLGLRGVRYGSSMQPGVDHKPP